MNQTVQLPKLYIFSDFRALFVQLSKVLHHHGKDFSRYYVLLTPHYDIPSSSITTYLLISNSYNYRIFGIRRRRASISISKFWCGLYFIVEIMVLTQSLVRLLLTIAMEIAVLTSTEKQFGKMTEILISKRFSSTSK